MPDQIQRSGKVTVKVDVTGTLETLGEVLDQPRIVDRSFHHDVPGDRHGGPQGPPIDRQFLGRIIDVQVELSRYDQTVADKLRARLNGAGAALAGTIQDADIGALAIQDTDTIRVLLASANDPMNFPTCIISEPIELNQGTKFSSLIFQFEAHRNQSTGVIFNTLIS